MAITGNLSSWSSRFPDSLVPQIIDLILNTWKSFSTNKTGEVPITQAFFVSLERNQEATRLPFLIDLEIIIPNEDGSKQQGRLDLRFIHGYRRKVYFAVECKRLRINPPSGFKALAGEYVKDGMLRYFNGQYAEGLDKGGMLGYVLDGEIDKALNDVKKAIENRRTSLHMGQEETLRRSSYMSSKQVRETIHQYGPKGHFVIYHIFLPMKQ